MKTLKILGSTLCLLAALVALIYQFQVSHLLPLLLASLFILPIRWLRPGWFRAAWILPIGGFLLLLVDAYALRHRIAVEVRAKVPLFVIARIAGTYVSPSGQTTVYLLESGFLDTFYSVRVSAGGLFPQSGYIPTQVDTPRRDLIAEWRGPLFVAGDRLISYAYSETEHRAYTYDEWIQGPRAPNDTTRTLEGFSAYINSLRPGR